MALSNDIRKAMMDAMREVCENGELSKFSNTGKSTPKVDAAMQACLDLYAAAKPKG